MPFLVMEYVDGRNLRDVLAQCAARRILLPVDFGCYVAHVVAGALAHAHEGRDEAGAPLGIVHCDVSPSNVFVSRLGAVKLGDFGVARAAGAGGRARGRVREDAVPRPRAHPRRAAHPAERRVRARRGASSSSLTNARAFPGRDVNEVGQRILAGPPARPVGGPPGAAVRARRARPALPRAGSAERWPERGGVAREIALRYDPARSARTLAIAAVVRGLFGVS